MKRTLGNRGMTAINVRMKSIGASGGRGRFRLAFTFLIAQALAGGLFAATIDYYHFSNNLLDSGSAASNGSVLAGSANYSGSVPSTAFANTASLQLGTGDTIVFDQSFGFDSPGDATLQFYINPGNFGTGDLFWTTASGGDSNRFNIFLDSIPGGYQLNVDYREPNGTLHNLLNPSQLGVAINYTIPVNLWTFVAVVRSGDTYSVFFNDDTTATAVATDVNPNLPNDGGWTINGRTLQSGCCQYSGLLDELMLSNTALDPTQFENQGAATPEPATLGLMGVSFLALWKLRRRSVRAGIDLSSR